MQPDATDDAAIQADLLTWESVYAFGPFRLDPTRRVLYRDGAPVNLTGRLFNALSYLVMHHDRLVSREQLESALWPSRKVDDNNLGQAIYALRKVLQAHGAGERFIVTVPGRGYQFAVPVTFHARPAVVLHAGGEAGAPLPTPEPVPANHRLRPLRWAFAAGLSTSLLLLMLAFARPLVFPSSAAMGPETTFAPPPHSIAVLAFTNLGGGFDQEYFSDGLSAELIGALGRLPALQVAAASSSFAFKGRAVASRDIGRRLNVRAVLEGSVRRADHRLRVSATLIDAQTGYVLWAQSYDYDQSGVFKLQEQIAEAVTGSVQVRLLGDDGQKLGLGGTTHPQALDAYLRGMKFRNEHTDEGIERAHVAFGEALALDPNYVLARVQNADVLIMRAEGYGAAGAAAAQVHDIQRQALNEAKQAVAQAPGLGEAHAVLALADAEFWDFAGQRAELALARDLAPNNSRILIAYARSEVDFGDASAAIAAAERAVTLDPLAPDVYADLVGVLALARRPDEALVALRHAQQLGFGGAPYTDLLARIELMHGDMQSAWRECAGAQDWYQLVCRAMAGHGIGRQADADAALAKLHALFGETAAYQYARIYTLWGQPDEALRWLETAYRIRDDGLIDIHADSFLDPLRGTARFKALEHDLGVVTCPSARQGCSG